MSCPLGLDATAVLDKTNGMEGGSCGLSCARLESGRPDRKTLSQKLQACMDKAISDGYGVMLVVLDIDDFARANHHFGEPTGDLILQKMSMFLCDQSAGEDFSAWLGGDEFALILNGLTDGEQGLTRVKKLLADLSESLSLLVPPPALTVSAGLSVFPQGELILADQMIRQSMDALHDAKVMGKNRYHFFDPVAEYRAFTFCRDLERLQQGLEQGELRLYYQPKVNMASGGLLGFEALIRWQHPERGLLPPDQFLGLLYLHPLELDVGHWVMETALRQVDAWKTQGLELPVSVNVSAQQLQQPGLAEQIRTLLANFPALHGGLLELEILESSVLSNMGQVCQLMAECRAMGIEFALDDFGTGYSSLAYLKRLPAATIKIDQGFVRNMLNDPEDQVILRGVIGLAKIFGRKVLAEGVETPAHAARLVELGCVMAQGYGIARPMPAEQVFEWCQRWQESPWCCG